MISFLAFGANVNYNFLRAGGILDQILPGGLGARADAAAGNDGADREAFVVGLVRNGIILLLVAVIIAAIVYAAISGLKFVTSQGEADKVESAKESIKYTLIGVAAAFLGIIGVVLIQSIFAPGTDFNKSLSCVLDPFNTTANYCQ